jgi:hypothetical protein
MYACHLAAAHPTEAGTQCGVHSPCLSYRGGHPLFRQGGRSVSQTAEEDTSGFKTDERSPDGLITTKPFETRANCVLTTLGSPGATGHALRTPTLSTAHRARVKTGKQRTRAWLGCTTRLGRPSRGPSKTCCLGPLGASFFLPHPACLGSPTHIWGQSSDCPPQIRCLLWEGDRCSHS